MRGLTMIYLAAVLACLVGSAKSLHMSIIEPEEGDKSVPCTNNESTLKVPLSSLPRDKHTSGYRRWPKEKLGWNFHQRTSSQRNLARHGDAACADYDESATDETPLSLVEPQQTTFFKFPIAKEQGKHNTTFGPPKTSAQMMNESQMQQLSPGTRVAVFWKSYNRYYEAKVLKVDQYLKTRFLVRYIEDKYEEWVDALRDDFKVIGDDENTKWTQLSMQELLLQTTQP
ncbi:expressed unknown protein [Seminavis robusta]|uniref:Tudor domain-containing protein n=1 Tax=Seminavis robusta TaxID=568900 RepID=A0A9N8HE29_9STRA|nr:expressed unknown protein [Seminavis robusta]|eukprot:Sro369_g128200.1 n/a (228) ;mRNA; r:39690-40373